MAQSNTEFAEKVGIHFTMASRLRNGQRLPGADLMYRISTEYDIPMEELARARDQGPGEFGRLLRDRIFNSVAA